VGTSKIAARNEAQAILRLPTAVLVMLVLGFDERIELFLEL
jgi:hypothetical protein